MAGERRLAPAFIFSLFYGLGKRTKADLSATDSTQMTQMRSSISRIRNRLNLAKLLLILALLFITYPPAMKAWESADSIPEEYSRIEYLMKEIDQYLPLVAVMGLLIFTLSDLTLKVEEIQAQIGADENHL